MENVILRGIIDGNTRKKLKDMNLSEELYREYLIKKLQFCKNYHHSPYNIALMPKTGKMNKKNSRLQIIDLILFLWSLELLYAGCDAIILTGDDNVFVDNRNELKECLLSFESVYDYCDLFYKGLSKDIIDKIIASGKKAINTPMRVHEYLNLVYEFWDKREKCIPNEILYSSKHNLFLEYSIIFNEYYEQILNNS